RFRPPEGPAGHPAKTASAALRAAASDRRAARGARAGWGEGALHALYAAHLGTTCHVWKHELRGSDLRVGLGAERGLLGSPHGPGAYPANDGCKGVAPASFTVPSFAATPFKVKPAIKP